MKNFTPTKSLIAGAFGLALALLAPCPSARAQVAAQQQPAQGQTRPAPGARQAARPRAGNLMRRLNLSRAQRLQLREIRRRREPEARELVRRVRLARRALDEAIYADAAEDSLVEQRAGELAAAQAALLRLRAATELKVRRVLTAEQLRAFRELRLQAQRRQLLQRRRADPDSQDTPAEPAPDAEDPYPRWTVVGGRRFTGADAETRTCRRRRFFYRPLSDDYRLRPIVYFPA